MSEINKNPIEIVQTALLNKNIILPGSEGEKRKKYDTDVYTPANRLGFETVSKVQMQQQTAPDLDAFEGTQRRFLRDNIVSQVPLLDSVTEKAFGKTSQPFPLDHTLGHLRHPDLYFTVGPPFYDTVLLGHIAESAAVALANGHDKDITANRARQAQVTRWRERFSSSKEDWYGQLIRTTEQIAQLAKNGQSFSERFPIDARTPITVRYNLGDKGNELVVHNIRLIRETSPNAISQELQNDDAVRVKLANGLVLTKEVLTEQGVLPASEHVYKSMDFYLDYLHKLRDTVGEKGKIESLSQQQQIFDDLYSKYIL